MSPEITTAVRDQYGRAVHTCQQGSVEWHELRRGLLTASVIADLITPGGKLAKADGKTVTGLINRLAAQRITGYVDPTYVSPDMLRGKTDEVTARNLYSQHVAPVVEVGLITRQIADTDIIIGASPDGLVGDDGMIEVKSRRQEYQVETVVTGEVPDEYRVQIQTQLMVAKRPWCDFISICAGEPLFIRRVEADKDLQRTIAEACVMAEERIAERVRLYRANVGTIPTERLAEAQDSDITT